MPRVGTVCFYQLALVFELSDFKIFISHTFSVGKHTLCIFSSHVYQRLLTSLWLRLLSHLYALLDRVDSCARPTRFVTSLTLCPARRRADSFTRLYLYWAILKYTTIPNVFLRCHSHRALGWVKQKPDNNCQTIRIMIRSFFFNFSAYSVLALLMQFSLGFYVV